MRLVVRSTTWLLLISLLTAAIFSVYTNIASAQPSYTINYQGKLTTPTGVAVANGTYEIEFNLYTAPTGGVAVWTETRSGGNEVTINDGLFSVMLGSVASLTSVNFNQPLYLGVTIEADAEMTPRKAIGSVPSAFEAKQLGGVASSSFLRSDQADVAGSLLTFNGGLISNSSSTLARLSFTNATGTSLFIGGDRITDFVGDGLQLSGGGGTTLSAVLGTNITAGEIANGDHGFFSYTGGVASLDSGGLTSANLSAALTNETGTGNVVFSDSPTFSTSIFSPGFFSTAFDVADAGVIRLANTEVIGWETSPTGVDRTLSVNSSNNFVFGGNGSIIPGTNDGASLGISGTAFSDLFLASGAVINFAAGNATITHSTGVITVGVSDLRVSTPGTNSASVVTVGGTQTLTNKTLTTPAITNATLSGFSNTFSSLTASRALFLGSASQATTTALSSALLNSLTDETGTGAAVFGTSPTFTTNINLGTAGVRLSDDGDGAITFLGLGNGNDESLTLNLDDNANTGSFTSSTGLDSLYFDNISLHGYTYNGTASVSGYEEYRASRFGIWKDNVNGADVTVYGQQIDAAVTDSGAGDSIVFGSSINTGIGNNDADTTYGQFVAAQSLSGVTYGLYVESYNAGGTAYGAIFASGNVGIGTSTPQSKLTVVGDLSLSGAFRDTSGDAGTNGQVLLTTGSGTNWVATSSLGFVGGLSAADINTSAEIAAIVGDETGSIAGGLLVFNNSPTLITPNLGTPSALTLTNATGLPISGITGLGTGVATWLATPSSSNLRTAMTDETGTGVLVFNNEPTFVDTGGAGGGTITLGASGMTISTDGDGALSFFGLGNDFDENLTLNLDDTANTGTFTSASGLNLINFSGIGLGATTGTFSSTLTMSGSAANIALGSNWLSGDGADEGIFVDSLGNVGIGTSTTANRPLTVQYTSGSGDAVLRLRGVPGGGQNTMEFYGGTAGIYNWLVGSEYNATGGFEITPSSAANGTTYNTPAFMVMRTGNVGVGTSSPYAKLSVAGNSAFTGQLNLAGTAANIALGSNFLSGDGGDEGIFVSSTGNVGIGTSSPVSLLDIARATGDGTDALLLRDADVSHGITSLVPNDAYLQVTSANSTSGGAYFRGLNDNGSVSGLVFDGVLGSASPTATVPAISFLAHKKNGTVTQPMGSTETAFQFSSLATNFLTILGSGNVGIGTSSPYAKLSVTGNSAFTGQLNLAGTAANIALGSNFLSGDGADEGISLDTSGRVTISTLSGSISEGLSIYNTSSAVGAGNRIDIGNNSVGQAYLTQEIMSSGNSDLYFTVRGSNTLTERMRITAAGNVGIGTSTPSQLLTVGATSGSQLLVSSTGVISDGTWQGDIIGAAYGGTGANTSGYTNGLLGYNSGSMTDIDTEGELETALGGLDVVTVTASDISSANFANILSDETGAGAVVFANGPAISDPTLSGTVTLSSMTPSRALFVDASQGIVTSATSAFLLNSLTDETGTGSVVFSISPFITGTADFVAGDFSSTLTMSGSAANIALGSNWLSGDGADEGIFVDSAGRVGVGTSTTASADMFVFDSTGSAEFIVGNGTPSSNPNSKIELQNYRGSQGDGNPAIVSFVSRGTAQSPTAVTSGMKLLSLQGVGYGTGGAPWNRTIGASIDFIAAATFGGGISTTDMVFSVGNSGHATERMRLTSAGNFGIGTSTPSEKLQVQGNLRVTGSYYDSSNDAGSNGMVLLSTGSGTNWVATSSLGISGGSVGADSLDFDDFMDSMTLDAATTIELSSSALLFSSGPSDIEFLNGNITAAGAVEADSLVTYSGILGQNNAASLYAANFVNDGNNVNRYGILIQAGLDNHATAGTNRLIQFNDGDGGSVGSINFGGGALTIDSGSNVLDLNGGAISVVSGFYVNMTEQVFATAGIETTFLAVTGEFFDENYSAGTNGMVLTSTGTGTEWVATSSLGISGGSVGADSLNFTDFSDTMSLDASTSIALDGSETLTINSTSSATPFAVNANVASAYVASFINDGDNVNRFGLLVQAGLDNASAAGPSTLMQFNDGDGTLAGSIKFGSDSLQIDATATSILALGENTAVTTFGNPSGSTLLQGTVSVDFIEIAQLKLGVNMYAGPGTSMQSSQFAVASDALLASTDAQFLYNGASGLETVASFSLDAASTLTSNYAGSILSIANDGANFTEAATGNHPLIGTVFLKPPAITGGAATVSNTATLYIEGAPSATVSGANMALWVDAGNAIFDGNVGIGDTTPDATLDIDSALTSGTIFNSSAPSGVTVAGALTGMNLNLNTNYTATGQSVTGYSVTTPTVANTAVATHTYRGLTVAGSALTRTSGAGTDAFTGVFITNANLTRTAGGTMTSDGVAVTTGSISGTNTTQQGFSVIGQGVAAGTLNGLNIATITGGAGTENAINIGTGYDNILNTTPFDIAGTGATTITPLTTFTTGTILSLGAGGATTLSGALTGINLNLSTSYTATGRDVTGYSVTTPAVTNVAGTFAYRGLTVTGSAITSNNVSSSNTFTGAFITNSNLTQTTGSAIANGVSVTTGTLTTGGTQQGINIIGQGVSVGTLNGINFANITGNSGTENAINVGTGYDNILNSATFDITGAGFTTINPSNTVTTGNAISLSYGVGVTLTGQYTGFSQDYTSFFTATNQSVTGNSVTLPAVTNTGASTYTYRGLTVSGGALVQNNASGQTIFSGAAITNANITQTNGSITANGVLVNTGTITTGGSQNGIYVNAQGVGAGAMAGIKFGSISGGAGLEDALSFGDGYDYLINHSNYYITGQGLTNISPHSSLASGNLIGSAASSGITLSDWLYGVNLNLQTNYTVTGENVTGYNVLLPGVTNSSGGSVITGMSVQGNPITSSGSGFNLFRGLAITNPNVTQTAGTSIATGISITTGTITTGGSQTGISIGSTGIGAGTLTGVEVGAITPGAGAELGVSVATGWDYGIYSASRMFVSADNATAYAGEFFNDGNNQNRYGLKVQGGADDASGTTYYLDAYDGDGGQVGYLANVAGTFGVTDISDLRTKTNVTDTEIVDATAVIQGLRVVDFNRIQDPDGPRITGFIAQEVDAVFSSAVTANPKTGYLGVMKDAFIPLLIKGAQEQQGVLSEQGGQLTTLAESLAGTITSIADLEDSLRQGFSDGYESNEEIEQGTIVMLASSGNKKVEPAERGTAPLGVVTQPVGLILGSEGSIAVAQAGKVAVKVNMEGGDISIGDAITLSSQDGVGTKATTTTRIVGIALEERDEDGVVLMSVQNELYFTADTTTALNDLFVLPENATGSDDTLWSRLKTLATNFVDGVLTTTGLNADRVNVAEELCVDGVCVNGDDLRALLESANRASEPEPTPVDPGGEEPVEDLEPPAEEPPVDPEPENPPSGEPAGEPAP